jgi:peptidoglycan-associated lipoprotein
MVGIKRSLGGVILTLAVLLFFLSGCAKKEILNADTAQKESPVAAQEKADIAKRAVDRETAGRVKVEREAAEKARVERGAAFNDQGGSGGAKKAAANDLKVLAKDLHALIDINFDFDKSNLQDNARSILDKHAAWLNKNKAVKITIEGHCDERGTGEYNLALGQRRAEAAAKYLINMGIDAKRIKIISYGYEQPLDPGHNEAAWSKNRRGDFLIAEK